MKNYYEAKELRDGSGFRAYIYDENGATVFLSNHVYETEPEAIDAAVEWAEDNSIDIQIERVVDGG